jgi:hypothetical protein
MDRTIHGFGGFVLRILSEAPDALVMEASYPGDAPFPPEHFHPSQEERFEVLEGTMIARVEGEERTFDTLTVPAGTVHTMRADGPARMRWEVRPALRTAEFFELLYAGQISDITSFDAEFRLA